MWDGSLQPARPVGDEVPLQPRALAAAVCRFILAQCELRAVLARCEGCGITCSWVSGSSAGSSLSPNMVFTRFFASWSWHTCNKVRQPWGGASALPHRVPMPWGLGLPPLCTGTQETLEHSPRGCRKVLVPQPSWQGRRMELCCTEPHWMGGGVGQVPAELTLPCS